MLAEEFDAFVDEAYLETVLYGEEVKDAGLIAKIVRQMLGTLWRHGLTIEKRRKCVRKSIPSAYQLRWREVEMQPECS